MKSPSSDSGWPQLSRAGRAPSSAITTRPRCGASAGGNGARPTWWWLLELIGPDALRAAVQPPNRQPGAKKLRNTLDRRTFTFTRSQLERHFLPIACRAGLPKPLTCVYVNGYEVDFFWPELGLVVETDGLTYHRTPAEQAADRRRDQTHTAAGLTPLRFTHGQIKYEPAYVLEILTTVARRLTRRAPA